MTTQTDSSPVLDWLKDHPRAGVWLVGPAVVGIGWCLASGGADPDLTTAIPAAYLATALYLLPVVVLLWAIPRTRAVGRWLAPWGDRTPGTRSDLSAVDPVDRKLARRIARAWPSDARLHGLEVNWGRPDRPDLRYPPIAAIRSVPLGLEVIVATMRGLPVARLVSARDDVAAAWGYPVDVAVTTQQEIIYLVRLRDALEGTRDASPDQPDIPQGWLS